MWLCHQAGGTIILLVALLLPSLAAAVQGVLVTSHIGATVFGLQVAKIGLLLHILLFSTLCLAGQIKIETETRLRALHDSLTGLPGPSLSRERLLGVIRAPYSIEGCDVTVGASIGVVLFPEERPDLADVLKAADTAMYEAKRNGKNTFRLAEGGWKQPSGPPHRLRLVGS